MKEIECCNLAYKVRTVMNESELEISFLIVRDDITTSHLPFMNSVPMR
jgi:hypothetical protein